MKVYEISGCEAPFAEGCGRTEDLPGRFRAILSSQQQLQRPGAVGTVCKNSKGFVFCVLATRLPLL
jgi:hypothetical protein